MQIASRTAGVEIILCRVRGHQRMITGARIGNRKRRRSTQQRLIDSRAAIHRQRHISRGRSGRSIHRRNRNRHQSVRAKRNRWRRNRGSGIGGFNGLRESGRGAACEVAVAVCINRGNRVYGYRKRRGSSVWRVRANRLRRSQRRRSVKELYAACRHS